MRQVCWSCSSLRTDAHLLRHGPECPLGGLFFGFGLYVLGLHRFSIFPKALRKKEAVCSLKGNQDGTSQIQLVLDPFAAVSFSALTVTWKRVHIMKFKNSELSHNNLEFDLS